MTGNEIDCLIYFCLISLNMIPLLYGSISVGPDGVRIKEVLLYFENNISNKVENRLGI